MDRTIQRKQKQWRNRRHPVFLYGVKCPQTQGRTRDQNQPRFYGIRRPINFFKALMTLMDVRSLWSQLWVVIKLSLIAVSLGGQFVLGVVIEDEGDDAIIILQKNFSKIALKLPYLLAVQMNWSDAPG